MVVRGGVEREDEQDMEGGEKCGERKLILAIHSLVGTLFPSQTSSFPSLLFSCPRLELISLFLKRLAGRRVPGSDSSSCKAGGHNGIVVGDDKAFKHA